MKELAIHRQRWGVACTAAMGMPSNTPHNLLVIFNRMLQAILINETLCHFSHLRDYIDYLGICASRDDRDNLDFALDDAFAASPGDDSPVRSRH